MTEVGTTHPVPTCEIEEISPETAEKWLGLNHANRRLSDPVVEQLAGVIRRGEWMEDCTDAIGLDVDEGVINGQHRLTAIVKSGRSVRALVLRNVRPEVIKVIDQGRGRTFIQWLQMQGTYTSPTVIAPAILWLYRMNNGLEVSVPTAFKPTIPQLLDLLNEHRNVQLSVAAANEAYKGIQVINKGHLCAYHYSMSSVDAGLAEDFFIGLASGAELGEKDPVRFLRERLMKQNALDATRRVRNFVMDAWFVRAWELKRQDAEITDKQLDWKASGRNPEPFPKITDLPWNTTDSAIEADDDEDGDEDFSEDAEE
jgi:hypothetical protein